MLAPGRARAKSAIASDTTTGMGDWQPGGVTALWPYAVSSAESASAATASLCAEAKEAGA